MAKKGSGFSTAEAEEKQRVAEIRGRFADARARGLTQEEAVAYANQAIEPRSVPKAEPKPAPKPFVRPAPVQEEVKEEPKAKPVAKPVASEPDDLMKINGIGSNTVRRLEAMGVKSFKQIASWSEDEARDVDHKLSMRGRILREDWVGQAKKLTT